MFPKTFRIRIKPKPSQGLHDGISKQKLSYYITVCNTKHTGAAPMQYSLPSKFYSYYLPTTTYISIHSDTVDEFPQLL